MVLDTLCLRACCITVFKAMALNRDTVSSEQRGHLGLVAATIRELGIIDKSL